MLFDPFGLGKGLNSRWAAQSVKCATDHQQNSAEENQHHPLGDRDGVGYTGQGLSLIQKANYIDTRNAYSQQGPRNAENREPE